MYSLNIFLEAEPLVILRLFPDVQLYSFTSFGVISVAGSSKMLSEQIHSQHTR